jgi:hypothetical protein
MGKDRDLVDYEPELICKYEGLPFRFASRPYLEPILGIAKQDTIKEIFCADKGSSSLSNGARTDLRG